MHPSTHRATLTRLVRTFLQLNSSRQLLQQQQLRQKQTHVRLPQSLIASATACCSSSRQQFLSTPTYPNFLVTRLTSSATIKLQQQQQQQPPQQQQQQLQYLHQQQPPLRLYSKFTAAREPTVLGSHPLCEERAHDLVSNLKDSERAAIKLALEKYDAMRQKEGFEGKLAASTWRSRFGRLTKVPALGEVDPTGSFCAFPDDWLKKKAAEKAKPPTSSELWRTFFVNAVPFVAFGFLDNFTMIVAGDYIEHVFGTFMCISTMAAAGLGNTISDVLGIGSAFYVERGCEFLGLRPPDLTAIQMEMKTTRRAANFGRIIGITVGCLIGMFPLLFMDKKPAVNPAAEEEVTSTAVQTE